MLFNEKVVIVTGGAQGIGRAISQSFAKEGAHVIIADIDKEAGIENSSIIEKQGGSATFIQTNVSSENEVKELVNTTITQHGRLDILVNNAGINHVESIYTMDVAAFDKVLATNLRSFFVTSKYAALEMKKAHSGSIINIASTRALMSEADTEAYAASKGGIVALTHALAISLGQDGIRVNSISPGWIEVRDWQKTGEATTPQHRPKDMAQHPVNRVGNPLDIAEACLYLASDRASFITGENLVIDGGMTKKMIYEE